MPIVRKRPLTPSQRFHEQNKRNVSKKRPERSLTESKKRTGGRNTYGRITSRRRGGGHKKLYRRIDFRREKFDMPATIEAIEYDPNRTSFIALLRYEDGEKRYIPAPRGLGEGSTIVSSESAVSFDPGNNMPVGVIPPGLRIHNIELQPGKGGQMVRSAGSAAQVVATEGSYTTIRMPSGEVRQIPRNCRATIGEVGNTDHQKESIGKAGRNRWKGRRPRVRGVAMNPVDHPMGGGEGRTSGGGHPVSPWGQLSKGYPTRRKRKASNRLILVRRDGRRIKR